MLQESKKTFKAGKYSPKALTTYFANANDDLFNTSIKGAEVYRSDDSGKSWKKVNSICIRQVSLIHMDIILGKFV